MTDRVCPICGKAPPADAMSSARPFCSDRCRNIDLGRWLKERYRIAAESSAEVVPEIGEAIRAIDLPRS